MKDEVDRQRRPSRAECQTAWAEFGQVRFELLQIAGGAVSLTSTAGWTARTASRSRPSPRGLAGDSRAAVIEGGVAVRWRQSRLRAPVGQRISSCARKCLTKRTSSLADTGQFVAGLAASTVWASRMPRKWNRSIETGLHVLRAPRVWDVRFRGGRGHLNWKSRVGRTTVSRRASSSCEAVRGNHSGLS